MRDFSTLLRFIWEYVRPYWMRLACGIVLAIVYGLSNGLFVGATQTILDRLTVRHSDAAEVQPAKKIQLNSSVLSRLQAGGSRIKQAIDPWLPLTGRALDWKQILGGLLLLPALVGLRGFSRYLSTYCMLWASERATIDLRHAVLRKLNTLSIDYHHRSKMGDLTARIHQDTQAVNRCLSFGLADLIREPMTMLGILIALLSIDWKLTLLGIVFVPVALIPLRVLGGKARRASSASGQAGIAQASLLYEMLASIRIVKAFGLEKRQESRFQEYSGRMLHSAMRTAQARELTNPLVETICMFGVGMMILYIFWSGTSAPDLVGFIAGLLLFYTPVRRLASIHLVFQECRFSLARLGKIFSETPTVVEAPDAKPIRNFDRIIRFENVGFSYGDALVLQNVSFEMAKGKKIGLAGESGSGKSTLVNLLFRFYDPTAGRITVDGQDLRELKLAQLRQLMALVSQEIVVFDLSVHDNILCGKPDASRAEVEAAARAAFAHEFIQALPKGYDTLLGERGVRLSGGQRQRISIARAFVRNAPILVLDEATASLDSNAEAQVQAAIDQLTENRTVLAIAHRLSTLAAADEVIVLQEGKVVERGAFPELLAANGTFAQMARRQGIGSAIARANGGAA